jgi:hypothetical protein
MPPNSTAHDLTIWQFMGDLIVPLERVRANFEIMV